MPSIQLKEVSKICLYVRMMRLKNIFEKINFFLKLNFF